ncbi:putative aminopyrimidine aminohydrolase [Yarrowia sp. B02]|nr:putative aminopyrimidine aminohydrolase [Yarrowia sp. B02]
MLRHMRKMRYTFMTDFDDTMTAGDTLALLSECAYSIKPGFKPDWTFFGSAYMADYSAFKRDFGSIDSLEKRLEFQKQLKSIEMASVHRVEKSDLYLGVSQAGIRAQAHKVEFKDGWWDFARKLETPIHVISVNWSDEFIRETFRAHDVTPGEVMANKVYMDELERGTGKLSSPENPGIRTSDDKLQCLKQIVNSQSEKTKSVYCGDSSTDLAALVEADIGLIIGNEATAELLEKYGKEVKRDAKTLEDGLYYFDDWTEVPVFE